MNKRYCIGTVYIILAMLILSGLAIAGENRILEFPSERMNILGNDYLCHDAGVRYDIAECCGDGTDTCNSYIGDAAGGDFTNPYYDGNRRLTGESIDMPSGRNYCLRNGSWSIDLDTLALADKRSCSSALMPNGTPERFVWTGTKCCSEPEDIDEFYNDPEGTGACWNGTSIYNKNWAEQDDIRVREVISVNGTFYGCAINETLFNPFNQDFLELKDFHTDEPLINNVAYCTLIKNGLGQNAFCSYNEEWEKTSMSEIHLSKVPPEFKATTPLEAWCCPTDQCWDGITCAADQLDDSSLRLHLDKYRCYNGTWEEVHLKNGYDNLDIGFCPEASQCLVGMDGRASSNGQPDMFYSSDPPKCVDSGDYFLDNYCENGVWTTRTRNVASTMILMAEQKGIDDYTLYCDTYQNALPEFEGLVPSVCERNTWTGECMNNICVLTYDRNVIVGTSFNMPLDTMEVDGFPFIDTCIGIAATDGKFVDCTGNKQIWYNSDLEAIIFNRYFIQESFNLKDENWFTVFTGLLKNKIYYVLDKIQIWRPVSTSFVGAPIDVDFITDATDFNKIYIKKAGEKQIVAISGNAVDKIGEPYPANPYDMGRGRFIAVNYKNYEGIDICDYIELYDKIYHQRGDIEGTPRALDSVVCSKEDDSYYIFARTAGQLETASTGSIYYLGDEIWQDLTSKHRFDAVSSTCNDECGDIGASRCSGSGVTTCGDHDDDICLEWSNIVLCPNGCSTGSCDPIDPDIPCTSHVTSSCSSGNLYWYDSCGTREDVKQDCVYGCDSGICRYNTLTPLDCSNPTVEPWKWYIDIVHRCGEPEGIAYWEADIAASGLAAAYTNFIASAESHCSGYGNYDLCNDAMLCHAGDDYISNSRWCNE